MLFDTPTQAAEDGTVPAALLNADQTRAVAHTIDRELGKQ